MFSTGRTPFRLSIVSGHWLGYMGLSSVGHPHRVFFDELGSKLGYKKIEDWYQVTKKDISKHEGGWLLRTYYKQSPSMALQSVFPEYHWLPWRFKTVPKQFWKNRDNHKQFFDWLGQELGYKQKEDWYKVTLDDIYKNGGKYCLVTYYNNSPSKVVQALYPTHKFDPDKFVWKSVRYLMTKHVQ